MPSDFGRWLDEACPTWTWHWPHLVLIQERLDQLTRGQVDRLMLFLPPRHGKSEAVTVRYPVYRLERDPSLRVIVGAYNQTLAEKFSRKSRRLARERLQLSKERTAVDDWETAAGGGLRAVGVGGGITGMGAQLIVIDDPVKSRQEAESAAYRDRVWEWYTDDLFTRREPGASLVLIQTRWHPDDLAGRILASPDGPRWSVLRLPAEAETQEERDEWARLLGLPTGEPDPLGRLPGEALCPERYDVEALREIRTVLGRSYHALYQQAPRPREGEFFKRSWFPIVERTAAGIAAERVRFWDRAGTAGDGDYTVGLLMAKSPEGRFVVEDVVRGRWSPAERDQRMLAAALRDRDRYGGRVQVWLEQEPGSSGKDSVEAARRLLAGHPVRAEPASGSKVVRADPLASQAEAGNVLLLRAEWNQPFLDELCDFPNGRHDDQVDAAAGAFAKLAQQWEMTFV